MSHVTVFTKIGCRHCVELKELLGLYAVNIVYVEVGALSVSEEARARVLMRKWTNHPSPTFPQMFAGAAWIEGGYAAARRLHESGELGWLFAEGMASGGVTPHDEWVQGLPIVADEDF